MAWTKSTSAATEWDSEHGYACIFDSTENHLSPRLRAFDISVFDEDATTIPSWSKQAVVSTTWTKSTAITSTYWSKDSAVSTTWTKSATATVP